MKPIMAKSLLTSMLHLSAFIFQATAFPRQNQALPVMPCGNALSKSNQNLCMTFNGGGVCTWDRTSMPHCRIGKDFGAAARLLGEALDKVSIPAKPYNAYAVIHAAKMFGTQHGNVQIKMRADEHERRLRFGRTPFDQSRSPQCLLNVPMCRRVACGGYGSQNNATQCLSNPDCCFDLSLYQYQFTYGSEFMGGSPACYHGPSSASFKKVIGLVKPWSAWFSGVVLDLFHEELMRPASLNNMQGCFAIASDRKTCGWHDITESECRLKDCCYTRHGTCVYPHSHVFNGLKTAGSYPDLYSTIPKHGQCTANPFRTHPSYDRLSCHRLTSDPYSVLSCPSECCLDKSAIEATLSTHGFISYNRPSHAVQGHQSNHHIATHSNPNYYTPPKAQPALNPMSGLSPITPDLVNMMSAIASTNQESVESSDVNQLMQQIMGNGQNIPSMHMPTLGKNPFMQMLPPAGNNPFGQMPSHGNNHFPQIPTGNPTGLDGGILQLFLNNGGSTPSSYGGGRSLNPDVNSMMDAYMVGLFNQGKSNTGLPQGMNPNMVYYLMQSKESGKGMDMSKLMQLGMMPYGLSQKGGQSVNPLLLTMLLGNKTGDNDMSDMMKYAMLQGNGNGGNNMATNMLLMNLMNKKGGSKDSSNNLMLMSMLSNMQRNRGQQHNVHAHKPPTNDEYNYQRYPPHETYRNHHRQDTQYTKTHGPSPTYTRPSPTQYQQSHPNNDRAFVNDLLSRRAATNPIPYCPYTFTRIGNFPDLTHAVRGCCKAIVCYHKKEVKRSDPAHLPKPTYSQWSAWTPCDKTCGVAAFRTRVRSCIRHNQLSIPCEGPSRQLEKCKLGPCHLSVIGQAQSGGMTEPDSMRRGLSMPGSEKPETKEELNALMQTLLRELDNPSTLPSAPIPPFPNNVPPTPSPINPFHTVPMKPFPMNTGTRSHSKQPPHMTRGPIGGVTPQKEHQYAPWSTWSICDRKCGGGNMIRMRLCMSENGGCQGKSEEINVCNTEACQDPAPSPISMATVSTPMNKLSPNPLQGLVPLPFDNQLETLPPVSPSHQSLIANKVDTPSNNFVYGAWSEWTQCRSGASNCTGDGTTTRQRACFIYLDDNTPVRQTNCKDSVQINPCKVVCKSINTSDELETVPGLPENETMQSVDESTDNVVEDLNDDGSWSRWSECKGPCGLDKGTSTRQRKCLTTVDDPFCDEVGFILKSQRTCTIPC